MAHFGTTLAFLILAFQFAAMMCGEDVAVEEQSNNGRKIAALLFYCKKVVPSSSSARRHADSWPGLGKYLKIPARTQSAVID